MGLSSKKPFEVGDFSGGITDKAFDPSTRTADVMDNFIILEDKHLLSRPGSVVDDTAHSPLPLGNQRIGSLINYAKNDKLFVQTAKKFYFRSGSGTGAYSLLQGPSSHDVLTAGDTSSCVTFAEWNKQLFVTSDAFPVLMRLYKDNLGVYQVRNAGMPALASNPTVTAGAAGANTYSYAFVMSYVYQVMTQTFKETGAVTIVQIINAAAPNSNAVSISNIPVLSNGSLQNWDTANIKVEIYRTINGGTNFYKVGEVTNGTTTFSDNMSDTTLQTQTELYINDGTLDFDAPPAAKFVHVVGNVGFLGYTSDANGEHPYRLQQSNPNNVNFWPKGFTLDVEEEVKGVKSVVNLPILLCQKRIFRIDGLFDSKGTGGMNAIKIHDSAGCISHLSCVEAEGMLYWFGNDGVYTTDGYKVFKVTDHLNKRYANFLANSNAKRIQGKFDALNRRIHWAVESNSASLDNDTVFTIDLRWGVSSEMTCYTWSGTSFRPTALEIFNNFLYRADNNGFVFKHDPTVLTDPKVDTNVASASWFLETIIWTWKSGQYNFGSSFFRKIVSRILLQAGNAGDTTIQITAINDQGKKTRDLKPIRWRRNFVWRADSFIWGNSDCIWDAIGLIDQWRRFPAKGLRLSYLQIQITNALGILANSDTSGLVAINKSTKAAVLSNSQTWPAQSVGYFLALSYDNYQRLFQVSNINGGLDTLTLLDSGNNLPATGSYKWELYGYQKGEPLNLLGFNLHWDNVDQNQGTFHGGDDGGNA